MAIQYVGGKTNSRLGATGTANFGISSGLAGGIGTTTQEGDLVVVTVVTGTALARHPSMSTASSGWTEVGTLYSDGSTYSACMSVSYKVMGTTPDSTFTIPSSGHVDDGQAWCAQVFRGVDPTTPMDVVAVTAAGTGTGRPNPGAITPVRAGAFVVVCTGAGAATQGGGMAFSDLTSVLIDGATDTNDAVMGCGIKTDWASGAFDPAQATSGPNTADAAWAAFTLALRPQGSSVAQDLAASATGTATGTAALAATKGIAANGAGQATGTAALKVEKPLAAGGVGQASGSAHLFAGSSQPLDAVAEIKALRIPSGPYMGGYEVAPNGKLNWYFANLALRRLIPYLSPSDLDTYVRVYLDLYISKLKATTYNIDDVIFNVGRADPTNVTLTRSDSDDSYAATFLSLVYAYHQAVGSSTWATTNLATLKNVAYNNIALQVKGNGLVRVYQAPDANDIGYLMDNAECYRGLRDFQSLLTALSDADASYYGSFADSVAAGIGSLWDATASAWRPSDAHTVAETSFYPGTTCQVFTEVFGVSEQSTRFTSAYGYLNTNSPDWPILAYDAFPWAVLGYAAHLRGDTSKSATQRQAINSLFRADRAKVTINELGWYLAFTAQVDLSAAGSASATGTASLSTSVAKDLVASASGQATGTAALAKDIALAAGGAGLASATIAMAKAVSIAASGSGSASGAAQIQVAKPLAAGGSATVTAQADLSTSNAVTLAAAAQASASGSASLTVAKPLSAAASGSGTASSALSIAKALGASGQAQASGAADLAVRGAFSATAVASATGSASLSVAKSLAAAGAGAVTGSASAAVVKALAASGSGSATGTASFEHGVSLAVSAQGSASASASLFHAVNLAAVASGAAEATADVHKAINLAAAAYGVGSGFAMVDVDALFSGLPSSQFVRIAPQAYAVDHDPDSAVGVTADHTYFADATSHSLACPLDHTRRVAA